MGKLRPIGSEKLQGLEKLNRILEIAKYKENIPNSVNESHSTEYSIVLPDGIQYTIDKEKNGYVIKKKIDESTFDYVEPMKNRNYYRSYSQAFKRLNLIAKEVNVLTGNNTEVSLFTEQKYVLKTPKAAPAPEPAPEPIETPSAEPSDMTDELPSETGTEGMETPTDMEMPMDSETDTMATEDGMEDSTFKGIQKLTGKLAQKIRTSDEEEMTADNIKYIVNSILSALDLSKLEDEDKEDIVARFEGEDQGEEGVSPEEMPGEEGVGDEMSLEEPEPPVEEMEMTEENNIGDVVEKIGSAFAGNAARAKFNMEQNDPDPTKFMETILDGIFKESKVDKVLSKYFILNESEKEEIQRKRKLFEQKKRKNIHISTKEIERLCESENQIKSARDIIKKYPSAKVIGTTNLKNLVIEHKGKQIKITPKGNIL